MSESENILLIGAGNALPAGVLEALQSWRPVREFDAGALPSPEDLELADLIVVAASAIEAEPTLAATLRNSTEAPLLLLEEEGPTGLAGRSEFDDVARVDAPEVLSRRVEFLLSFRELWRQANDLAVSREEVSAALGRYELSPGLVGPRGIRPPGKVSIRDLVDVEAVNRQQMAICQLMGTAYGTFLNAIVPQGLPGAKGEESSPTGALSPYCAYLSGQGDRCLLSEHGVARQALDSRGPVERTCAGGIVIYSVPVCLTFHGMTYPLFAASVAVVGVPDEAAISGVAEEYGVNPEILGQMATESRFWVLNRDKSDEIKETLTNLAETISREVSHKYGTAYQLFRGLLTEYEIRRSERLLAESHRELEETNRRLTLKNEEIYEVTHAITHDLRKPLVSLKAGVGLLRKGLLGELEERQFQAIDTAYEATGYMEALVEDLLESARLDTGRRTLDVRECAIEALLEKVRKRFQYQLDERGIQLEIRDIPPAIMCDEGAIEKVFMNLIGNSISYIGDGEKRIIVSGRILEEMAEITVEDTGVGIPEESQPLIFEKFQRGGNVREIRGTGLGLAIVKGMVEAHGGAVSLTSKVNEGTTARFTLPLAEVLSPGLD